MFWTSGLAYIYLTKLSNNQREKQLADLTIGIAVNKFVGTKVVLSKVVLTKVVLTKVVLMKVVITKVVTFK